MGSRSLPAAALQYSSSAGGPDKVRPTETMKFALLLAFVTALLTPLPARAQIYAWRDVNGTLVLSDRKLNDGAMTYAVPEAPGIRATTPLADAAVRAQFEPLVREHAARHSLRADL